MLLACLFLSILFLPCGSIKCASCEFLLKPTARDCNETCTGDVCFIVTSPHFNATVNAGCFKLRDGDNFTEKAVCGRTPADVRCVCTTELCNSPGETIDEFKFGEVALPEYQYVPQIEPQFPGPVPPRLEPEPLEPIDTSSNADSNETSVSQEIEPTTSKPKDPEMIVTKTVGFQVRNSSEEIVPTTASPNSVQSDVEITQAVTSEPTKGMTTKGVGSIHTELLSTSQPRPQNSSLVVAEEDPNSCTKIGFSMIFLVFSILIL